MVKEKRIADATKKITANLEENAGGEEKVKDLLKEAISRTFAGDHKSRVEIEAGEGCPWRI